MNPETEGGRIEEYQAVMNISERLGMPMTEERARRIVAEEQQAENAIVEGLMSEQPDLPLKDALITARRQRIAEQLTAVERALGLTINEKE